MTRVFDPCANCGHPRRNHSYYLGAGLNPGGRGVCLTRDCPCEKYVAEPPVQEAQHAA